MSVLYVLRCPECYTLLRTLPWPPTAETTACWCGTCNVNQPLGACISLYEPPTQTIADVQKATAVKLSLTSKGYKATVKADTPHEALALAIAAHSDMTTLMKAMLAPSGDPIRSALPILVFKNEDGYYLEHGGGDCVPFDPSEDLDDRYVVKIDLELNSKGIGWTVGVKSSSTDGGAAMIYWMETQLATAFPGGNA